MRVVITGAGAVGRHLANDLAERGHAVTVIEQEPAVAGKADRPGVRVILGDGCEPWVLEQAELRTADVLVAATGDDEDNLVTSLLAKQEFGVPRVLARVNHPKNEWMFTENWGVDQFVSTPQLITSLVEEAVNACVEWAGMTPDQLIAEHMDWAEKLARSFSRKLPPSFDADDLVQLGLMGLMKAADRYDPAKTDSFRGFASSYVLGECRMGVRRRHWREATAEPLDANGVTAVIRTRSEAAQEDAQDAQRAAWRERRRRDLLRAKLHRLDAHGQRIARLVLEDPDYHF